MEVDEQAAESVVPETLPPAPAIQAKNPVAGETQKLPPRIVSLVRSTPAATDAEKDPPSPDPKKRKSSNKPRGKRARNGGSGGGSSTRRVLVVDRWPLESGPGSP